MDRLLKEWNPYGFHLFFVILIGCAPTESTNTSVNIKSSAIDIPIGAKYLSSYYDSDFFDKGGSSFFMGYNHTTHAFDCFDLKNKTLHKSIKLENEGPNGIPSVGRFAANRNFIATIYGNTFIYFISHEGNVIKKFKFEDIPNTEGLSLAPLELTFGNFSKISFSDRNVLTLPVYQKLKRRNESFYNYFYIMEIQFDGEEINTSFTKCTFPEMFRENFYGDLDLPYVEMINGDLMYNFPALPNLFRLSNDRQSTTAWHIETDKPQTATSPFNKVTYSLSAARRDYFFNSSRFFYPVYDPYQKFYYLVRKNKTEHIDDKYKEHFLMIFDEDFDYLHEIKVDPDLMPLYNVVEEGIIFSYNPKSIKSESLLSFHVMDIAVNN